jgi:hypothetical protein
LHRTIPHWCIYREVQAAGCQANAIQGRENNYGLTSESGQETPGRGAASFKVCTGESSKTIQDLTLKKP